ncbi:MAG TPA: hypothetical protein VLZ72_03520 [Flavobacterium sp.]|nr:hypothetical protein [Flavobacterium sp.]
MRYFESGKYINQGYYKSFQPNFINRNWEITDMSVFQLLSQADRHVGRLDMYSETTLFTTVFTYLLKINQYLNKI